ncbi:tryptophan--tRNA ligase [Candidatus Berkelbacteria bacterium]|nr:tryptophan--tRNA ligase [Candidatus Berkelbacteria bacterium]
MANVFSGIQPTGTLHLGNYLGAMKQWVALQATTDCIFAVVDYHAITTPFDPKTFHRLALETAAWFIAAGLDPKKTIMFRQSDIAEHTELAWILNTITPLGDLERMTQFKEKSRSAQRGIMAGLLNYPVLMAADILLYQAKTVPVGEDQFQHLELTRAIARRFNSKFGETFVEPKPTAGKAARIMSLANPGQKMSKSGGNYIGLSDRSEIITKKVMAAVTDQKPIPGTMSPGVANLFTILGYLTPEPAQTLKSEYDNGSLKYVDLKAAVADAIINELKPVQEKFYRLTKDIASVEAVLADGAKRAQPIAAKTMVNVKQHLGL